MSVSAQQPEFDFWEWVHCAKCHLPFSTDTQAPPQTPFWLTECGHVVCNSHLNADQSCPQCGRRDIQLAPLQRDMDPPMSDWFRSIPYAYDSMANAVKFQQETMASLIRYYKKKCIDRGLLISRLKGEAAENKILKKTLEQLTFENSQLRQDAGYAHPHTIAEPDLHTNSNGKRPRLGTSSSPRSIVTPIGPNRLTLPAGQRPPELSDRHEEHRPGTNRFVQQYAYNPPKTPHSQSQFQAQRLSHAQSAPLHLFQQDQHSQQESKRPNNTMPPPPVPNRQNVKHTTGKEQVSSHERNPGTQPISVSGRPSHRTNHNPNSTPNQSQNRIRMAPFTDQQTEPHQTRSFIPVPLTPSNRFVPSTSQGQGQYFIPPHPSGAPQRFTASRSHIPFTESGPRAPSRQRMPFFPAEPGFG